MEQNEIIGFMTFSLLAIIIAYILHRYNKFTLPLILWGAASFAWFTYIKVNQDNSLWFVDFDSMGVWIGFLGVVGLGLFYALQTYLMFALSAEFSNREGSKGYMLIPICAIIIGILLILVNKGYLSAWWIALPAGTIIVGIIGAMWSQWDDIDDLTYWFSILAILCVIACYVYTFPRIIESSAWFFTLLFIVLLLISPRGQALQGSLRSLKDSKINSHSVKIKTLSSKNQDEPMMIVSFKGKYYLNGMKQINRKIKCTSDEISKYTPYMYDKDKQLAWILATYPGAEIEKGWSLNVNITKE